MKAVTLGGLVLAALLVVVLNALPRESVVISCTLQVGVLEGEWWQSVDGLTLLLVFVREPSSPCRGVFLIASAESCARFEFQLFTENDSLPTLAFVRNVDSRDADHVGFFLQRSPRVLFASSALWSDRFALVRDSPKNELVARLRGLAQETLRQSDREDLVGAAMKHLKEIRARSHGNN